MSRHMDKKKSSAPPADENSWIDHDSAYVPNGDSADDDDLHLMEQFMANPAHDYPRLRYGDTIDGVIMRIDKDGMLVNIGTKAEALVPTREMQSLTPEDRALLHVGDEILVFVLQPEDKEGYALLSLDKARQEQRWRRLEDAHQNHEVLEAPVVNYNKGGLLVDLDGIRGFVPSSQVLSLGRTNDSQRQSDMARMVGQTLQLKVIELNRSRNRLILSERQAMQDLRKDRKHHVLQSVSEGDICEGTVRSVCSFGAFVDIGGADGLIHLSELSWGRIHHPNEVVQVGQTVQVAILSVDMERNRIALSLKRTQREPWATLTERYEPGQIVSGTVSQLASFGAFVRIEAGVEGLVHLTELAYEKVQRPHEVVSEGQEVQVRILRIDPERKRLGLSLRLDPEAKDAPTEISPTPDDPQDDSAYAGEAPVVPQHEQATAE